MKYEGGLDDMASIYNKFSDVSNIFIFVAFWFQLVLIYFNTLFRFFHISRIQSTILKLHLFKE